MIWFIQGLGQKPRMAGVSSDAKTADDRATKYRIRVVAAHNRGV
jgi:hypothetical protein